ncbi:hypothetical protein EQU06_02975 [Lactobacillus sanfranciscensis]|uniref:Uncharacterized protein n=1 Tax=Fructilactobacillus sanfranciscensis (strain TMW 1.1304) TaxID=714313 RepID=G2KTE9_FRUST|nr:hypothetical protein [Fructilactobacillus sanfranciscensis]AEN98765.1 hypothetical protein LSA_03100 [Fructilactobacillus sanfranciscensis TMW 1.1304]NDR75672.1 hypothetical protein [Fructilactobacillus sanfranciscensis]NDR96526.1 hypothetical protein [Fructilactobacillus sanfranciscensis]NDS04345.1 hypothetical protein [Fructilactobacillus sanfranciscensis]POH17347.1 hypothetical protein BGL44_03665 [Fructilactobacillus sanfranciscensis]
MNNQDQDTRFQRYDFTPKRSQNKRKHRPHIWPWILGLVIVVLILTFGIRYALNTSNQVTNNTATSKSTSTNSSDNSDNSSNKNSKGNDTTSSAPATQPAKSASPAMSPSASSSFAEPHTFNSVQDAKDWANATKPDWTSDGYNYWTVTQNSQGYYVLTFTK